MLVLAHPLLPATQFLDIESGKLHVRERGNNLMIEASAFIAGNHREQDLLSPWDLDGGGAAATASISSVEKHALREG